MMRLSMVTIWVKNPQALRDWYVSNLGMKVLQETQRFVQLGWEEEPGLLAFHVGEPLSEPNRIQFHVRVHDVDDAYEKLSTKGIHFAEPPSDKPWGLRTVSTSDPAGHSLEFEAPIE